MVPMDPFAIIAWTLLLMILGCLALLAGCAVEVYRGARQDRLTEAAPAARIDPIAHHRHGCKCPGHR